MVKFVRKFFYLSPPVATISTKIPSPRIAVHNQIYWRNEEYLGIGAGAYSYIDGERRWNVKSPMEYIKKIQGVKDSRAQGIFNVIVGREILEGKGVMGETIMIGLRMLEGINLKNFKKRFRVELKSI